MHLFLSLHLLAQPCLPARRPLLPSVFRKSAELCPQRFDFFDQVVDALVGFAVEGAIQNIVQQHGESHLYGSFRKGISGNGFEDPIHCRLKGFAAEGTQTPEQQGKDDDRGENQQDALSAGKNHRTLPLRSKRSTKQRTAAGKAPLYRSFACSSVHGRQFTAVFGSIRHIFNYSIFRVPS